MATSQEIIEIIINGVDRASGAFSAVAAGLGELNDKALRVAQPFADLADGFLKTETVAVATGAALVGFATHTADSFDKSFREIATLIDLPLAGLENFRKEILDYAATSTQSLNQVTGAVYNAVSQGVAYTQSLQVVSVAEKLAVAGKAELNITLQALLGTLNAYGKGMESAGQFSDIFFETVKLGKTTVPELAASISGVTSTAALGKVSFAELGAAIATVTFAGAPTSEAITRINAVLSAMIKPSGEAVDLAKSLGLAFDVQSLQSKGLAGVLADVVAKTGGAADKMAILFGSTEALNAATVLAVTNSNKFSANLAEYAHIDGIVSTAFDKMKDATYTFGQALEVAAVKLGTPLLDPLRKVTEALADIGIAFGKSIDAGVLQGVQGQLVGFANTIADTFAAIAKNLPKALEGVDFQPLITAFGDLGKAVSALWDQFSGGLDLTTVEGLQKALQLLVNSGAAVTEVVAGIIHAFEPFAAAAGQAVDNFQRLDQASKIEFGEFLGAMKAIVAAGPQVGGALLAIGRAGIDVGEVINIAFGSIRAGANALQVGFDTIALAIVNVGKTVIGVSLDFQKWAGGDSATVTALQRQYDGLEQTTDSIAANLERNSREMREGWNQATGEASEKAQVLRDRLQNTSAALREHTAAQRESGDAARVAVQGYDGILAKLNQIDAAAPKATTAISDLGEAQKKLIVSGDVSLGNEPIKNLIKTWDENGIPTYKALDGAVIKATGSFAAMTDQISQQAEKTREATKDSLDFKAKMEEIASNERIKNIDAVVRLNVAQFEADAKRVEAAFHSIDNTVSSTGDLLGNMFGQLKDADFHARSLIENQIAIENERRQKALDLQTKLTEAEIERINAQAAALNRSDGMIKIEATGLEPELEAFLWKILQKIQVRANASFTDYLLGLPAPGAPA